MGATGFIYIPKLNPVKFHRLDLSDFWREKIPFMEDQHACFVQKFQRNDILYLQFLAGFNMKTYSGAWIVDNTNTTVHTFTLQTGITYGGLTVYYIKENIPALTEGIYYIKVSVDWEIEPVVRYFFSEPIWISARHENTLLIAYRHTASIFDCIFGGVNLPQFYIRVDGGIQSSGVTPGGKFAMYHDLDYKPVMLQTQPFNTYRYVFGNSYGIPAWMSDILNRAFSLDYTYINGIRYMRNEGAKLERKGDDTSPLAGYSIELLAVDNEYSDRYTGYSGAVSGGGGAIEDQILNDGKWEDAATVDDRAIFSVDEEPA